MTVPVRPVLGILLVAAVLWSAGADKEVGVSSSEVVLLQESAMFVDTAKDIIGFIKEVRDMIEKTKEKLGSLQEDFVVIQSLAGRELDNTESDPLSILQDDVANMIMEVIAQIRKVALAVGASMTGKGEEFGSYKNVFKYYGEDEKLAELKAVLERAKLFLQEGNHKMTQQQVLAVHAALSQKLFLPKVIAGDEARATNEFLLEVAPSYAFQGATSPTADESSPPPTPLKQVRMYLGDSRPSESDLASSLSDSMISDASDASDVSMNSRTTSGDSVGGSDVEEDDLTDWRNDLKDEVGNIASILGSIVKFATSTFKDSEKPLQQLLVYMESKRKDNPNKLGASMDSKYDAANTYLKCFMSLMRAQTDEIISNQVLKTYMPGPAVVYHADEMGSPRGSPRLETVGSPRYPLPTVHRGRGRTTAFPDRGRVGDGDSDAANSKKTIMENLAKIMKLASKNPMSLENIDSGLRSVKKIMTVVENICQTLRVWSPNVSGQTSFEDILKKLDAVTMLKSKRNLPKSFIESKAMISSSSVVVKSYSQNSIAFWNAMMVELQGLRDILKSMEGAHNKAKRTCETAYETAVAKCHEGSLHAASQCSKSDWFLMQMATYALKMSEDVHVGADPAVMLQFLQNETEGSLGTEESLRTEESLGEKFWNKMRSLLKGCSASYDYGDSSVPSDQEMSDRQFYEEVEKAAFGPKPITTPRNPYFSVFSRIKDDERRDACRFAYYSKLIKDNDNVVFEFQGGKYFVQSTEILRAMIGYSTCVPAVNEASMMVFEMLRIIAPRDRNFMSSHHKLFKDENARSEMKNTLLNAVLNIGTLNNCAIGKAARSIFRKLRDDQSLNNAELLLKDRAPMAFLRPLFYDKLKDHYGVIALNARENGDVTAAQPKASEDADDREVPQESEYKHYGSMRELETEPSPDNESSDEDELPKLTVTEMANYAAIRKENIDEADYTMKSDPSETSIGNIFAKLNIVLNDERNFKTDKRRYKRLQELWSKLKKLRTLLIEMDKNRGMLVAHWRNSEKLGAMDSRCKQKVNDAELTCSAVHIGMKRVCESTEWSKSKRKGSAVSILAGSAPGSMSNQAMSTHRLAETIQTQVLDAADGAFNVLDTHLYNGGELLPGDHCEKVLESSGDKPADSLASSRTDDSPADSLTNSRTDDSPADSPAGSPADSPAGSRFNRRGGSSIDSDREYVYRGEHHEGGIFGVGPDVPNSWVR